MNTKIIAITSRAIICLCCLLLPATGWAADGWQSLFNGKDLIGWKASENQGGFKVVDGAIAFDGKRCHLFYVGEVQHADFHTHLKGGPTVGQVMIHTFMEMIQKCRPDYKDFWMPKPEGQKPVQRNHRP